ncbi:MAG: mechanosensitive ion channel family protein [bacterium]
MEMLRSILQYSFFGIPVEKYVIAFLFVLAGFVARRLILTVMNRLGRLAGKTRMALDDILIEALGQPLGAVAVLVGIWVAVAVFPLPTEPVDIHRLVHAAMESAVVVVAIWFGVRLVDRLGRRWKELAVRTETRLDDQIIAIATKSGKVFLWIVGGVIIIQNMGYSVASLLAAFGLGGAALAFASKDTLSNFFGSIVIFVDRPFQVGDWIEVGNHEGTVEEVGLRVTRVRTFPNSVITIPNAIFTTSTINNWSRMKKRRIKLNIGVTYDTPRDKLEKAVNAIREVLVQDENIHQEFFMVYFTEFGAYSLDILVYCFSVATGWSEHLRVRQEVMLKILDAIHGLGLSFAFPTQTLHLRGNGLPPEGAPAAMTRELPL